MPALRNVLKELSGSTDTFSEEATAILVEFFASCAQGHVLLDRVVEEVNTRLHRRPSCALLKRFCSNWCTPVEAVWLMQDLGLSQGNYQKLMGFGHDKSAQFTGPTKLPRMPNVWLS